MRRTALLALLPLVVACSDADDTTFQLLRQDILIAADYWEDEPRILAAGLGFTGIIGVPGFTRSPHGEALVRAAGGTWNDTQCADGREPPLRAITSASTPAQTRIFYGQAVIEGDGFPIEFSWPVLPSTLEGTDFRVDLNTGESVTPQAASIFPNYEFNERSTVVIFGKFGNRLAPGEPGAVYPVRTTVVDDGTPLRLAGPDGRVESAVGLSYGDDTTPQTAYVRPRGGPGLVAAKLTRMSTRGENNPPLQPALPNDGLTLYGDAAEYRLRVLTTGGISPDGVLGILPTEFARYFRISFLDSSGTTRFLSEAGNPVETGFGTLEVVGLADLGNPMDPLDECYVPDNDNQLDFILRGDEAAMRRILSVEAPGEGGWDPLFNPGGPGNAPTPGVTYSAPSPWIRQPVTIALDDPMVVDWPPLP